MARRLGKKKQQKREDYMLKEVNKVEGGVFDTKTMIFLAKFYNKGVISKLNFIIARGKEADVYVAEPGTADNVRKDELIIIKFFRVETSSFYKMGDYMMGDPRFSKVKNEKRSIITAWCKKEFGNLEIAAKAKVNAPRPIMLNGSILAMSFIGEDGVPAPQLKHTDLAHPEETLKIILSDIKKLYKAKLVHGDVSEYNILMKDGKPYMIDFGQGVVLRHPKSMDFLKRDVHNVVNYFLKQYGIESDPEKELKKIIS